MDKITAQKLISYYRECYRTDSRDLSLWDLKKVKSDWRVFLEKKDSLFSGQLPAIPISLNEAEPLLKSIASYHRERTLICSLIHIEGPIALESGFSKKRRLFSPIIYAPSEISQEEALVSIDTNDIRVNFPLLRELVSDTLALDSFPDIQFPIDYTFISQISRWFAQHTDLNEIEKLGAWPSLNQPSNRSPNKLAINVSSCLALVDRPRGARGVLHELSLLKDKNHYSPPLLQLLGEEQAEASDVNSSSHTFLKSSLSQPQQKAVHNAATKTLSEISGPPGTGKSYTIAAMAIDRMLNNESVLIVSQNSEAVNVVAKMLKEKFSLTSGIMNVSDKDAIKNLKSYLADLLRSNIDDGFGLSKSSRLEISLVQLSKEYETLVKRYEKSVKIENKLSEYDIQTTLSLVKKINRFLLKSKINDRLSYEILLNIFELKSDVNRHEHRFINAYRESSIQKLLLKHRGEIKKFAKAISAKNSGRQALVFNELNFSSVLSMFPIWISDLESIYKTVPNSKELFDLVIVDEASQCNVSAILPTLQRAKRAVIIGDHKQIRHFSFLSRSFQEKIYVKNNLPLNNLSQYSYRDVSALDLTSEAISNQESVSFLDEHFRSYPQIIQFSNEKFYSGRLKPMKLDNHRQASEHLEFIKVAGQRDAQGVNVVEAQKVFGILRDVINNSSDIEATSIGVLSPFRNQVEYLEEQITQLFTHGEIDHHRIKVATPNGFQGDERDIMVLSFSLDDNATRAAAYLNRDDIFNVAITRAKSRQINIYSCEPKTLKDGLLKKYLMSSADYKLQSSAPIPPQWESIVQAILNLGGTVKTDYPVSGLVLDLYLEYEGKALGLDLFGFQGRGNQVLKQGSVDTLIRAGVRIIAVSYYAWKQDPQAILDYIKGQLMIN